jgi:TnpA family transposase
MPVSFLSEAERLRLNSFPADLSNDDLIAYFTLGDTDLLQIPKTASAANRLGVALQLVLLRFLGFHLVELKSLPETVVNYVAQQIDASTEQLNFYGEREQTRTDHQRFIEKYLGFRHPTEEDYRRVGEWLLERALEHDRPTLLLQLLCERFLAEKLVRPGFSVVERMVATARNSAEEEIFRRVESIIDEVLEEELDNILQASEPNRPTPLAWLRQSATSNTPKTILAGLNKLEKLQKWQVGNWNLSAVNPNRRKQLAQIGFRSTAQALSRMNKTRRYPILLAFLSQLHTEVLDELVELFDRLLQRISSRTDRKLKEIGLEIARLAGDKIKLLQELVRIMLDPMISDGELRKVIHKFLPESKMRLTFDECERINEPLDESYFKLIGKSYSYLRQFIPTFLNSLPLDGNAETAGLREAIEILRDLDESGKRKIPDDAPVDFVSNDWWDYVFNEKGRINRKYFELCVLFELRAKLRSGDIWVEGSRRFARLNSYLIPFEEWEAARPVVCDLLALPEDGESRLQLRQAELQELYSQFDQFFDHLLRKNKHKESKAKNHPAGFDNEESLNGKINVKLENGKLVVTKLPGEAQSLSSQALEDEIVSRLPEIELTDLLIEVDGWTRFSRFFEHPSGNEPRTPDALRHCYACILAQACNFGFMQMQRMSGLTYRKMAWYSTWYLREETLKSAFSELVNYHSRLPLAAIWGGGTLSSSDGQRFPVAVKARNAVSIPRYFGYGRGLTYYTWTSDQYSQYGTKVVSSTIRDATYVLDEILDNETELTILEHTTDTAGYTDLVFGLFDLLGLQFSPRLADIAAKTLYCVDKKNRYKHINSLITGKINVDLILRHWDDLLRIAGSLKQGYVTASLLISKLQSPKQKNALTKALQEWGKLNETIFILKYLQKPEYQKKIRVQLNKGEALHALRRDLFIANEGKIRKRNHEDQLNQAACLNLVVNAITVWNTVYMQAALEQLKNEGYEINEDDIRHLSPARSEHINMYGRYYFNVEEGLQRKGLRELRKSGSDLLFDFV